MDYKINRTPQGVVQYPLHTHKNYEIMLYTEGRGFMRTEMGDVPFEPGTVVIVPPNVKHGSTSKSGFKNISVEGDFDAYLCIDEPKTFTDNESGEGLMLASLLYENRYGGAYASALCTAYICFLISRFEVENSIKSSVKSIALEISQNAFDSKINLALILSKSGYSEDYIRACFKKITGQTPNEFLTDIRIKRACFLIDVYKNELSLAQIAERCGYTDYVYFSKKFKSTTGISPRNYAKQ